MTREISRQAFVRGALGAVAAGALLGSCRPTAPDPPRRSSSTSSTVIRSAGLERPSVDAIEGRVILPSSADYAAAKNLFNCRFDNSTPAAVVVGQIEQRRAEGRRVRREERHQGRRPQWRALLHRCFGGRQRDGRRPATATRRDRLRRQAAGSQRFRLQHNWIRCKRRWPRMAGRSPAAAARPSASPV